MCGCLWEGPCQAVGWSDGGDNPYLLGSSMGIFCAIFCCVASHDTTPRDRFLLQLLQQVMRCRMARKE